MSTFWLVTSRDETDLREKSAETAKLNVTECISEVFQENRHRRNTARRNL